MADNIKITVDNARLMVTAAVEGALGLKRLIARLNGVRTLLDDEPSTAYRQAKEQSDER